MIHQWQKKADTVRLCRLLGVSRSGLYAARRRRPRPCALSAPLQSAFQASGGNYGSRRLCAALKAQGLPAGRHRVRRLMKQQGLRARWKRTFVHTTDSRHDLPVAANVLDRRFKPAAPDQAWVADITYIRTDRGLTLPRFHVHQNVDNFLMNGERDGQQSIGTEPAVPG